MEYNSACTDIILTLKGSNYNGNQNSIKFSKKQLTFNTESAAKVLIGSTFGFIIKVKRTNAEQADIFRTKARYIHLFFANGKADTIKDIDDIDSKDIDRKVEHDCQSKQFQDRCKNQVKPDCKQSKT